LLTAGSSFIYPIEGDHQVVANSHNGPAVASGDVAMEQFSAVKLLQASRDLQSNVHQLLDTQHLHTTQSTSTVNRFITAPLIGQRGVL